MSYKNKTLPGTLEVACDSSICKAKARRPWVESQSGLHGMMLCKNNQTETVLSFLCPHFIKKMN